MLGPSPLRKRATREMENCLSDGQTDRQTVDGRFIFDKGASIKYHQGGPGQLSHALALMSRKAQHSTIAAFPNLNIRQKPTEIHKSWETIQLPNFLTVYQTSCRNNALCFGETPAIKSSRGARYSPCQESH